MNICLAMIVKNEALVIRRSLSSVLPVISSWAIVDTGSNDGTQKIIREFLKEIPGELIEREWVDFSTNRNQAIELAKDKADYIITLDADEEFIAPVFSLPDLNQKDLWNIEVVFGTLRYQRRALWRSGLQAKYVGILHEALVIDDVFTEGTLPGCYLLPRPEGNRSSDPEKYRKDAIVLEQALLSEPDNTRYQFYCAQSHRDYGDLERALHWYAICAASGGWVQERFIARYQMAVIKEQLGRPWPEIQDDYLQAYELDPLRAEPLYKIGYHYQDQGRWALALHFYEAAMMIQEPVAALFVDHSIYVHFLPLNYAVALYWRGSYQKSLEINRKLLEDPELPDYLKELIQNNMKFAINVLKQEA